LLSALSAIHPAGYERAVGTDWQHKKDQLVEL